MTNPENNDAVRHAEFEALVANTLGKNYDIRKITAVEALQVELFDKQAKLYSQYSKEELDADAYVKELNVLSGRVFLSCADILGRDDFECLFGSPVEEELWRIDVDAFKTHEELCRRALSAAYEKEDGLHLSSNMTPAEIWDKLENWVKVPQA